VTSVVERISCGFQWNFLILDLMCVLHFSESILDLSNCNLRSCILVSPAQSLCRRLWAPVFCLGIFLRISIQPLSIPGRAVSFGHNSDQAARFSFTEDLCHRFSSGPRAARSRD
jgi:hypothetical protein